MRRLLLLCAVLATTAALSCTPCQPKKCKPPQGCHWLFGTVKDVCNCCLACGRVLGQRCGAIFAGSPKCGRFLKCVKPPLPPGLNIANQWGRCVWKFNLYHGGKGKKW